MISPIAAPARVLGHLARGVMLAACVGVLAFVAGAVADAAQASGWATIDQSRALVSGVVVGALAALLGLAMLAPSATSRNPRDAMSLRQLAAVANVLALRIAPSAAARIVAVLTWLTWLGVGVSLGNIMLTACVALVPLAFGVLAISAWSTELDEARAAVAARPSALARV